MTGILGLYRRARQIHAYLDQGDVWVPDAKPPLLITDMDPVWRYNAAQFMARRGRHYLLDYDLGERLTPEPMVREVIAEVDGQPVYGGWVGLGPSPDSMAADAMERGRDEASEARRRDPQAWLESTPLYRALVKDLPDGVAELAKHWSTCAVRTEAGACTCQARHLPECPKREDINACCLCWDDSPEWTI